MLNSTIVANINGGFPPGQKISSGLHSSMLMSDIEFAVTEVKTNAPSSNEQQKFIQRIGGKGSPTMIFNGYNKGVNFLDNNRNPQAKPVRVVNGNKNGIESADDDGPSPKISLYHGKISSEWQQPHKIGAGLINLGNTCFMNTVLQCLTYCPPLANYLLHDSNHSAKCKISGFCMMCELQRHMKRVIDRPGDLIKPLPIHQKLKSIAKFFQYDRQEDAHEFLRYVIDNLWKSCLANYEGHAKLDPASKETTVINKIFGGYHRSQVICLRCKEKNNTYDHFMDFILDVKQNVSTLEKALEKFIQPELLQNDNAYKCINCKMKVSAQKKFSIYRPSNVATFQFKRFDYNRMCGSKITKHISYPEVLNLRPYMSNSKGGPIWYRLNAVLVHQGGTCNSGHYFCYVRNSNGFWYLMDDARVQQVSLNHVLNQGAYVLFYIRTNPSENVAAAKRPAESSASTLKNNQLPKNGFIGSTSVSPNPITRPSLNLKSSALPAISKLTVSSSLSTNAIPNITPNNIIPKRALQPLSQDREKVVFSFSSAKNINKLPKTPTPNPPTNVVKNETPFAKGLVNGNLLVPYIEDSSDSSEEDTKPESRKNDEANKSKSGLPPNLNKTFSSAGKTFSNNNNYLNVRENSELSKPSSIVDVKAKSRISSNFKHAIKYNSLASCAEASLPLNKDLCNNATNADSQRLNLNQASSLASPLKKGNFQQPPKSCNITEESKAPYLEVGSERKLKTCSNTLFNLNYTLESGSSSSKVNATTQWSVTDANLRSPSIASGSSTNSVNSTTEWNVTEHEPGIRRKSDQKNHGWTSHVKAVDKSNKENKVSNNSKQYKLSGDSAHADITVNSAANAAKTSKLLINNCDENQVSNADLADVNKDEASVSKFHTDKSTLNGNVSLPLSKSCPFSEIPLPRSPAPVKTKLESAKSMDHKNQIFLAQEQSQNKPFQFKENQSFLNSPRDTFQDSVTQRDSKAEKSPSLKRCFSDAVEDSCEERSSRFSDHGENSHGAVFKKLKTDSNFESKDDNSLVMRNNHHNLSSSNSEKVSISKSLSSRSLEKGESGLKCNGEIRTEVHDSDIQSKFSNSDSSSLPLNNQQCQSFGYGKHISRGSQNSQTDKKSASRKSQKHPESDSEQDTSSKSSVEYEWVEKTKETIEIEKTSTSVKIPDNSNKTKCSPSENNQKIDIVSELQKYGTHNMFGAEVGSWNNSHKRTYDNNNYDNRRYNFDRYNEEFDRGKVRRQKHQFKTKHKNFNQFQEAQNMRNKHKVPFYNKWNSGKYYSNHQRGERHYGGPYHNGYSRSHFHNTHGNKHRHFRR